MSDDEKTFEFALRRHHYFVQTAANHLEAVDMGFEECCKRSATLACGCTFEMVFGKEWDRTLFKAGKSK